MAVALGLLGTLALPTDVEAAAVRCDSCKTNSDFMLAAEGRGPGIHSVYNLHDNTIQRWQIFSRSPPGGNPYSVDFQSRVPTDAGASASGGIRQPSRLRNVASEENELEMAHRLYVINKNTLRPIFNVPMAELDVPAINNRTIYDIMFDNNLEAQISSAAAEPSLIQKFVSANAVNAIFDLMNVATSALGLKDQAQIIFRIVDTEGSYLNVIVRIDDPVGDVRKDTARMASGQLIPESMQFISGTWANRGVDNLARLAAHMERLGATVEYRGGGSGGGTDGGSGGGTITGIVCTLSRCVVEQLEE